MNSTADSATKLRATIAEAMTLNSDRKATANWERAQRLAYGQHHRESDFAGEEMILVDSTLTINHAPPVVTQQATSNDHPSPSSTSQNGINGNAGNTAQTPSWKMAGTLAKLAAGGALVATGAGAGIGFPLLFSGGKEVVEHVLTAPQATPRTPPNVTSNTTDNGSNNETGGRGVRYILELAK